MATFEREVKLRFPDADSARRAIARAGATPLRQRRLQDDRLLDTPDGVLRARRCALRLRADGDRHVVTFKGPVQPAVEKLREETETVVGSGVVLLSILEELGFHVWFRYQKFREEFASAGLVLALDETPVGTFVELEGGGEGIAAVAAALGRGPADYLVDSYRDLYVADCAARGVSPGNMLFEAE